MLTLGLGVGTIPWLLLGELCPVQVCSFNFIRYKFKITLFHNIVEFQSLKKQNEKAQIETATNMSQCNNFKWSEKLFPIVSVFQVKGFASGVVACVASGVIFVVVKVFPFLIVNIGPHGTYYVFGCVCLAMAFFCIFFVPDTRGKSVAELHMLYDKQKTNQTP